MHPADIRAALRKAGHTNWSIAQRVIGRHGRPVSEQAVTAVVYSRSRSDAIALAIAAAVGRSPADLWPDAYAAPLIAQAKPHYRLRLDGSRELVDAGRTA